MKGNILNLGVEPSHSLEKRKKIQILNLLCWVGSIISGFFLGLNLYKQNWFLMKVDIGLILILSLTILINYKGYYTYGLLMMSVVLGIIMYYSTIQTKNGAEYFLLLIAGSHFLLQDNKKVALIGSVFIGLLFLYAVYIINSQPIPDAVDYYRIVINASIAVFLNILVNYYFTSLQNRYSTILSNEAKRLEDNYEVIYEQKNKLEEVNAQLKKLNQAKEKLFTLIAHDVRSPIATFKSTLDLLSHNVINEEDFKYYTQQISNQTDEMLSNLNNLLFWGKSQLEGFKAFPQWISLREHFVETLNLLKQTIQNKEIQVELSIDSNLMVYADKDHLSVILRNLISNATKYSNPKSKITITANYNDEDAYIKSFIKDEGVGMSADLVMQLLENKLNNSMLGTLNEKGSGLGLSLTKEFLEKNNGYLSIHSQEGVGSTFCFTLKGKNNPLLLARD